MSYRLVRREKREELFGELLEFITGIARRSVERKGSFTAGLAGGSSPRDLYRRMREEFPYWEESYFLPTDERCVPSTDPRSNWRMIRELLGERARVYRIRTELSPEEACGEFDRELSRIGRLDFILLGIGEDGHTASLFPRTPCEPCGVNACLSESPDGLKRISMSLEFINRSGEIAFLVFGESKRKALTALIHGGDIPARKVRGKGDIFVFTDLEVSGG